eukprot:m.20015 g.20015  ORF g.20015 m.20015 type:complete len:168 (+) comp27951_c0_seq1:113-616(+)
MVSKSALLFLTVLGFSLVSGQFLPIFPSNNLVANIQPEAQQDDVFAISSLYAALTGGKVVDEPNHSYNGAANFKLPAVSSGNTLFLPFTRAYLHQPHCTVDLEGIVAIHTVNPQSDGLYIYLFDTNGKALSWTFPGYRYIVGMCWGAFANPRANVAVGKSNKTVNAV